MQAVVFDVGETLVDEAATSERWEAEAATTFVFADRDLHSDALPCLAALRARGLRLGAAGNMHAVHEDFLRRHVDFVGSSERWGVEKPDAGFFARVVAEAGAPAGAILYVGDRVDNDVVPALAAGLRAVRIRRGAHAHVESPAGTITIGSLDELPGVLADA
ncbi:MAG: HAD family hydrolase [Gaiellaceae bacterium]